MAYCGVAWNPDHGKWVVRIRVDGRETYFGSFADVHEAGRVAAARRSEVIAREVAKVAA
jgi:hypothetical protein